MDLTESDFLTAQPEQQMCLMEEETINSKTMVVGLDTVTLVGYDYLEIKNLETIIHGFIEALQKTERGELKEPQVKGFRLDT